MNSFSDKIPPSFDKRTDDFAKWSRKFRLWMTITEVDLRNRGALLLLHLDDDTQDRISDLVSEEDIAKDTAVDVILEHLKRFFGKDESVTTFELYEQFESFKRPVEMTISEYCDEFDRRLKKLQAKGTQLPEPVLVFKLLKSANLSEFEEMLVRATIGEYKYVNMAKQLKKVFPVGASVGESMGGINDVHSKDKPREVKETLYHRGNRYRCDDRSFSNISGSANYSQDTRNLTPKKLTGTNQLEMHGNGIRCLICDSLMHYMKDCTHRVDNKYRINKEDGLDPDEVKFSNDRSFTYDIAEVEAHHTVHHCHLRFESDHRVGEKPTYTEKESTKVRLITNQPTQRQAKYMDEEDADESQIHEGTINMEENREEQDQVTHDELDTITDSASDEKVSDEEKLEGEESETDEPKGRPRKYTKPTVRRATKGNIYSSKKAISASNSKKMDAPTLVVSRGYKQLKAKYKGAASGHLHQGIKIKKRKRRARCKKVQRREKRRISYTVFKSKLETKMLWKGKKQWKRRKKRRVWDGKLDRGSWDWLERLSSRRRERREVKYKERKCV